MDFGILPVFDTYTYAILPKGSLVITVFKAKRMSGISTELFCDTVGKTTNVPWFINYKLIERCTPYKIDSSLMTHHGALLDEIMNDLDSRGEYSLPQGYHDNVIGRIYLKFIFKLQDLTPYLPI